MKKAWWRSKTLWANAVALAVLAVQLKTGWLIPVEYQTGVLAGVNLILRLVTGEAVGLHDAAPGA